MGFLAFMGSAAAADEPSAPSASTQPSSVPVSQPAPRPLEDDALLRDLVNDALALRPELAQAQAAIQVELARVPQASAMPDPVIAVGMQNDGFTSITIGQMESSYVSIMAAQTIPWPGKRELRSDVNMLQVRAAESDLVRARLTVAAEVERAYVDLLLVRDQLRLQDQLEALWNQAEGLARTRYESGEGAQSDIVRAQLERGRLTQRRWALESAQVQRLATLNRLSGHALDDAVNAERSLRDLADPVVDATNAAQQAAELRSPELQRARLGVEQAGKLTALAERDYFPDVTVSAGVMPRGLKFEPMWQAGLSFSLPIYAGGRQARTVDESRLRAMSVQQGVEVTRQLLRQRVVERHAQLRALNATNQLYRGGLLVQSEATVTSTMAQYQVGRVTFASVLEALTGYVADLELLLNSIAAAQRVAIAERELSLASPGDLGGGGMGGAAVPGAGASGGSSSPRNAAPQPDGSAGSGSMSRM